MATRLSPGIYRDDDSCVFLVDDDGIVWLVDHAGGVDDDLPRVVEGGLEAAEALPFPCVELEDAAEYRRMVDEAKRPKTWRDRPPLFW